PDSRRNSVQRYEILPPKPAEFDLELHETASSTGAGSSSAAVAASSGSLEVGGAAPLRLYLRHRLDRESRDIYRMQIAAFDGGFPTLNGTVWLVVRVADENDERPTFEKQQYEASVEESASPGTEILRLKATDRDAGPNGQVVYSIPAFAPARIRSLFSVDSDTGILRLVGSLDFERQREYRVTVVAQDLGGGSARQSDTQVLICLIDVNDEKPVIVLNSETDRLSVAENEPAKKTVTLMTVTDSDSGVNGQVDCSLTNHLDKFSLEQLSSKSGSAHYNLVTARSLDRETDSPTAGSIQLTVRCVDLGHPQNTAELTVPVDVLDRNDNVPMFAMAAYHFRVNERTQPGTAVFALTDRDEGKNSRLTFWLNGTTMFSIGSDSGQATLIQRLDRELLVEGDNNHGPFVRDRFHFRVMEDAVVATESSDTSEIFRLFRLDDRDGRLTLAAQLDRELRAKHQFLVDVLDARDRRATTEVVVEVDDVNDCRPRFVYPSAGNSSLRIRPNIRVSSSVATLLAVDADDPKAGSHGNGKVRYSILSPPEETLPFHLDADTGHLVLVRPLPPSLLSGRPLNLRIRARDGGTPALESTETLTVTVSTDAEAAAAASDSSTTSVIDAPSKLWPTKVGGGGDRAEGAGSGGSGGGGSSDSLLIAAGLASVTCAFVLILGLGVGAIVCRRRCL
uniref:Cadherin domain-containing protein n=1 Tax=Macrostomum lignano TaxID=282301 RepID=A0A1I8HXJ6_9PLAT